MKTDEAPGCLTASARPARDFRHRISVQMNPYAVESAKYKLAMGRKIAPQRRQKKETVRKTTRQRSIKREAATQIQGQDHHDAEIDLIEEYTDDPDTTVPKNDNGNVDAEMDIIDSYSEVSGETTDEDPEYAKTFDTINAGTGDLGDTTDEDPEYAKAVQMTEADTVDTGPFHRGNMTREDFEGALILSKMPYHDPCRIVAAAYAAEAEEILKLTASRSRNATRSDTGGAASAQVACSLCCGRTFATRSTLKRHVDVVHRGAPRVKEKASVCDRCGITFTARSSLRRHLEKVHKVLGSFSYRCALCGMVTPRKDRLKTHVEKNACRGVGGEI